jgi:hypothetical protein
VLILGGNQLAGGYEVDNSLRFNKASSDHLSITPSSAGSLQKYTFSCWVKRSTLGANASLFGARVDANTNFFITFRDDDDLYIKNKIGGTEKTLITNRVFRDVSAWYHVVVAMDTTQGTASNRTKIYINGVQETSFSTEEYPAQDANTAVNQTVEHNVGDDVSDSGFFNGYLAEVVFIDDAQLDPTSFGEFDEDTGIWKPKAVSGLTFGTNGFYLDFEDSGALGDDVSGNGNNFTVNNLTAIDQTTDTCTNNFATMNPLDNYYASSTFSEGNTKIVTDASAKAANTSTFGISSGKWYCEIKATNIYNGYAQFGIKGKVSTSTTDGVGDGTDGYAYTASGGDKINNGSASSYGTTWNSNDIIGIAIDLDNNKLYFSRNGTFQNSGDPTSGATGTGAAFSLGTPSSGAYYIASSDGDTAGGSANSFEFNFGNPPFTISSGNSDGNGYGNFEYAVPCGYYALNTKNLAEYG